MQLTKKTWTIKDGIEFKKHLQTFACDEKTTIWEKKIINTSMDFYSIKSANIAKICKLIATGNFQAFIDLWMTDNYPLITVLGVLICKIKDFKIKKEYLLKYAKLVDNWAQIDLLKFNIKDTEKQLYFDFAKTLIKNSKPMARRMGIRILFDFIKDDHYIDQIFTILNEFSSETEYYVNMANAWIIAECFINQRTKTLVFLKNHKLNKFTINKAISKCRDSFRVTDADKQLLLQYKLV